MRAFLENFDCIIRYGGQDSKVIHELAVSISMMIIIMSFKLFYYILFLIEKLNLKREKNYWPIDTGK